MELLELEMRRRAIKALLKKEEEGEGADRADDWSDDDDDDLIGARDTPIQRSFKADDYIGDRQQHAATGHHRPSDLATSSVPSKALPNVIHQPPTHRSSVDGEHNRRHLSSAINYGDEEVLFRKSQQQSRHYRHHQHHRHRHERDRDRSRSSPRRSQPEVRRNESPPSPKEVERRPSPFLSPPPKSTHGEALKQMAQIDDTNKKEKKALKELRRLEDRIAAATSAPVQEKTSTSSAPVAVSAAAAPVTAERDDDYEEYGIQEVDIELGSGSDFSSDDDANSARI